MTQHQATHNHEILDDGERMIPDRHRGTLIYAEHVVRYRLASQLVKGLRVLDVASGTGYGAEFLKEAGATLVVGVDRSTQATRYAQAHHSGGQPDYLVGDAEALPLADSCFDVVVSFETIEHVDNHHRFIAEVRRVLRPGGLAVFSTPNRGVYLEGNPFHTREFTYSEFAGEMQAAFVNVAILAQDNWIASAVLPTTAVGRADLCLEESTEVYKAAANTPDRTLYLLALCSDTALPSVTPGLALSDVHEAHEYVREIDRLGQALQVEKAAAQDIERSAALTRRQMDEVGRKLAQHADIITEMEQFLEQRERTLNDAGQQLQAIRASFGYRMLESYRSLARWLFPQNSWRGLPYRAARKAFKLGLRTPRRALSLLGQAGKARQRYGSVGMVGKSIDHFTGRLGNPLDPVRYALSVDWHPGGLPPPAPSRLANRDEPTINWVIPTVGEGGGLRTIFRFVEFLESHGFRQRVYEMPVGRPPRRSKEELRALIRRYFGISIKDVSLDFENMEPADVTFATSWHTAYPVARFNDTHLKCYFVQDFEPYFAPVGTESAMTENTYRMGFHGITAGRWLSEKLAADYGMECDYFDLSVDTRIYFPKEMGPRRRIFFYARPATPRRGFELGVRALEVFHERNPGYQVVMAGGDIPSGTFSFPVTEVGYVAEDKLNDLYNQSAAALVISLTNCSLLPLEIMATGCPVVTTIGDNNKKILPPDSAILAVPSPHHIAEALEQAVKRPFRKELVEAATRYKWEDQADKVAAILHGLIDRVAAR